MSKKRNHFEMKRGHSLLHVITLPDGSLTATDIYSGKKKDLVFRNPGHMWSFAKKHNYTVTRFANS